MGLVSYVTKGDYIYVTFLKLTSILVSGPDTCDAVRTYEYSTFRKE